MTSNQAASESGVMLSGLDGSNPLAFLAALGALRTLTLAWPTRAVKLRWSEHSGAWRPSISATSPPLNDGHESQCALLAALGEQLASSFEEHPVATLPDLTQFDSRETRGCIAKQVEASTPSNRDQAGPDWLSALSSDFAPGATCQLQTVRRDYFIGNLRCIIDRTQPTHLERCLFRPWDYADALESQSLHWDPSEDRRYAYQWTKPSGDPSRKKKGGMLGANRLAIEAIPFFQSIASGDKLTTRGFYGHHADDTRWTWPIWSWPLGFDTVGSLLALADLQAESPELDRLNQSGIVEVYRCRRILVEKTPNFTPAVAL